MSLGAASELSNISENCQAPFCIIYQLHTTQFIAGKRRRPDLGWRGALEAVHMETGNPDSYLPPHMDGSGGFFIFLQGKGGPPAAERVLYLIYIICSRDIFVE